MALNFDINKYSAIIKNLDTVVCTGKVSQVIGLAVECVGLNARMGDVCSVQTGKDAYVTAEVVGFRDNKVLLMPLGELSGVGPEYKVRATNERLKVPVGARMLGRVIDAFGNPMDGLGPFEFEAMRPIDNQPPSPLLRRRIKEVLPLGVKAIDSMLTIGKGQRIGIFAGSGVGKSTLLGMMARNARSDVNVIILVGERGREVRDFLEKDLQEEGLKKSVIVCATSDRPALERLKSASAGTSVAEYFRDQGCDVLLMMDSLTRFAMAQREIGMAIGEPPVSRGYTPSVYAAMPKLLERSGSSDKGAITALYTVLVEGDDMNEPISDTVRGILDGHIVLSRKLANNNHYPAIDVLHSVSRLMPDIVTKEHYGQAGKVRNLMSVYRDMQDLIAIGAYKKGSDPEVDRAIAQMGPINELLMQQVGENYSFEEIVDMLMQIG
ncbi:MAG: flagellar protein export ATPase FliI [Clostridiales bacterium]|jgi:flagellum-specific ATP synthase|nr:flagellar protein export ATPase FliI [Clostridiales bacterium]